MCINITVDPMSDDRVLEAILPDKHRDRLRPFIRRFFAVPAFARFAQAHESTIALELRNQSTLQDCLDVVAELEFACLLAPHVAHFDYQVKLPDKPKRLDFVLHFPTTDCIGAEVKRIREPDAVTQLYGNDYSEIPYTQRESFKFTDRILEDALPQLHPEYPNVVFFQISSATHEPDDAYEALAHVVKHYHDGNNDFFASKGFLSRQQFLEQYRKLSAVVVRSEFTPLAGRQINHYARNRLFINPDATLPIPEAMAEAFRHADICT